MLFGSRSDSIQRIKSPWLRPYQFKPGQSGNPRGTPTGYISFAQRIAQETNNGEEMLVRLLAIMRDPAREDHLRAIELLLDRMIGKAKQHIELETSETEAEFGSDFRDRLASRLAELLASRFLQGSDARAAVVEAPSAAPQLNGSGV